MPQLELLCGLGSVEKEIFLLVTGLEPANAAFSRCFVLVLLLDYGQSLVNEMVKWELG